MDTSACHPQIEHTMSLCVIITSKTLESHTNNNYPLPPTFYEYRIIVHAYRISILICASPFTKEEIQDIIKIKRKKAIVNLSPTFNDLAQANVLNQIVGICNQDMAMYQNILRSLNSISYNKRIPSRRPRALDSP